MGHLQELYAKYRDKGLVVLGVNTADVEEIAAKLLEENGVSFPNILDTTTEAQHALREYETAAMSAVPMTYLIDREGKVMDAWYGYNKGKTAEAVKRLKLDEQP